MNSTTNDSTKGNIFMLGTLIITLVLPLTLILLSYLGIIAGTAEYIAALAVIASSVYIVGGGIWMFVQDKKDGKILADG